MPGMNGRQLATRIRAADPQPAILIMTGHALSSNTGEPFAPFTGVVLNGGSGSNWTLASCCSERPEAALPRRPDAVRRRSQFHPYEASGQCEEMAGTGPRTVVHDRSAVRHAIPGD